MMSRRLDKKRWMAASSVACLLLLTVVGAYLAVKSNRLDHSLVDGRQESEQVRSHAGLTPTELSTSSAGRRTPGLGEPSGLRCESASGEPIAGVQISVDGSSLGVTDSDGQLRSALLPDGLAGNLALVEAHHHSFLTFRGYLLFPLQGQTINLQREVGVTIRVRDEQQRPIAGAHCWLGDPTAERVLAEGWAGRKGQARLEGVAPQAAGLLVTAPGFVADWRLLEVTEDLHSIDVQLRSGRVLLVRVSDASGSPVVGARVEGLLPQTTSHDPPIPKTVSTSGSDGVATIEDLPWGRTWLQLTVSAGGYTTLISDEPLPAEPSLSPVDVVLRAVAGVRISCRQSDGTHVEAEVDLVLLDKSVGGFIDLPRRARVGLNGTELHGLPSGIALGAVATVDGNFAGLVEIWGARPGGGARREYRSSGA